MEPARTCESLFGFQERKGTDLNIKISRDGAVSLISLQGKFNAASAREFRDTALERLRQGDRAVVVDFFEVEDIDGTALSALVSYYRKLVIEEGGRLALAGLNPEVREFVDRAALSKMFSVFYDHKEAIKELSR